MGLVRLELTTSRLSGVRSNLLSYKPKQEPSKDVPRNALQRKPEEREALVRMTTDFCDIFAHSVVNCLESFGYDLRSRPQASALFPRTASKISQNS